MTSMQSRGRTRNQHTVQGRGIGQEGDTVAALLQRGRRIEAIKVYRMLHGVGLKEAKDAVDTILRDLEIDS